MTTVQELTPVGQRVQAFYEANPFPAPGFAKILQNASCAPQGSDVSVGDE